VKHTDVEVVSTKVDRAVQKEVARLREMKLDAQAAETRIADQRRLAHLYWKKGAVTVEPRLYTIWLWGYLAAGGEIEYAADGRSSQLVFQRLDPRKRKHKLTGIEGAWTLSFIPEGVEVEVPEDLSELRACVFFDFNNYRLIRSPESTFKVAVFNDCIIQMRGMAQLLKAGEDAGERLIPRLSDLDGRDGPEKAGGDVARGTHTSALIDSLSARGRKTPSRAHP
jgi:hypothetical protein